MNPWGYRKFINIYPGTFYVWPLPPSVPKIMVSGHPGFCWTIGEAIRPQKNVGTCSTVANPIHVGLGIKLQTERDYASSTLMFTRSYVGGAIDSPVATLGTGWLHTYQSRLELVGGTLHVFRNNGRAFQFAYAPPTVIADPDIADRITELVDANGARQGWQYHVAATDDEEQYDVTGRLVSLTTRAGRTTTLSYDPQGRLEVVTDPYGRTLRLTYDTSNRIATLTDPAGGVYTYGYDTSNNLVSVTYPDATPGDMTDNPTRLYHYEDTRFPNNLTGITDENGDRFATYTYDDLGRAVSSEHAGGAEKTTLTYDLVNLTSTVTDALNTTRTYTFTVSHGVMKPNTIVQPSLTK
jgi:YD repeat-containing protein